MCRNGVGLCAATRGVRPIATGRRLTGEDTAMRVLTISRGYTKVCAAAPAIPPAAKRSATVALPGSRARCLLRTSKATNLVAVSGITLMTLAPLPRKKARAPPSRYTAFAASARVSRPDDADVDADVDPDVDPDDDIRDPPVAVVATVAPPP